jgi:hypothetical protein
MVSLNSFILFARGLEVQLDLQKEKEDLRSLGLTEEEIEGYIEFYWDNWFPVLPAQSGKSLS